MHASVQYKCCCTVLEELGFEGPSARKPDRVLVLDHHVQFCDSCAVGLMSASNCTALHCTVLFCVSAVLCCTVLYYTVFFHCCTVPSHAVLYCTVMYFTVLYCTVLYPGLVSHHVRFHATHFRHLVRAFVRERCASSCASGARVRARVRARVVRGFVREWCAGSCANGARVCVVSKKKTGLMLPSDIRDIQGKWTTTYIGNTT